ncbi:ABC transporter substrate-binding protein [Desulfovibrio aminophilus]|nr:ABC transporter substrate-binding protein [Desulfovibrio aminophilus]MCM0755894.1 ABC transporter substrate-binding protein [Desulfovibrio aminophilus]
MKRAAHALIVLALACLWAAPALAEASLKIAHATWVGYGPLYIAKEQGIFQNNGLNVELTVIEDESQYAAAMASGSIDGVGNVLDREVIHYAKGTPEMVVCAMDESAGGDGIVASGAIKTLADLKGKTVGLDKSTTSYFFFLTALKKAGVAENALTIQEMAASDAGAAFVAERLDAAVTWEPWLTKASERKGGHVLVTSRDFPRTIVDVLVLRKEAVEKNPGADAALAKSWNEAVAWYKANPDAGNALMAKAMGLKTEEMADMAKGVRFFGKTENLDFFDRRKPGNIFEVAARAGAFWQAKGIISKTLDVDGLISDKAVTEAAK